MWNNSSLIYSQVLSELQLSNSSNIRWTHQAVSPSRVIKTELVHSDTPARSSVYSASPPVLEGLSDSPSLSFCLTVSPGCQSAGTVRAFLLSPKYTSKCSKCCSSVMFWKLSERLTVKYRHLLVYWYNSGNDDNQNGSDSWGQWTRGQEPSGQKAKTWNWPKHTNHEDLQTNSFITLYILLPQSPQSVDLKAIICFLCLCIHFTLYLPSPP